MGKSRPIEVIHPKRSSAAHTGCEIKNAPSQIFFLNFFDVGSVFDPQFNEVKQTMNGKIVFAGLVSVALTISATAKDVDVSKLPPASSQKDVTYAKDIKSIFDKSCIKCHGAEKPKAKLRLDSLAGALKGSADNKVIEPGNSAKSILVHNIARIGDEDDWMPPKDNKAKIPALTAEQVGLIRAWIDQGAK